MNIAKFHWDDADCVVQLSDGTIKEVNTCLVCEAEYDHYWEMHGEHGGMLDFWEIYPIKETIKPFAPDEYFIDGIENESNVYIEKIIEYDDNYGWEWVLS